MRPPPSLVAAAIAAGLPAQVTMTHLLEIDVADAQSGIGDAVSAVAWTGTDLYVAGYNASTAARAVAINRLASALGPAPAWGTPFGVQSSVPPQRGYINLDWNGATQQLAAGFDPGSPVPDGLTVRDANGALLWQRAGRGSSGVAFDPGFPGGNPALGAGTAWARFGASGRALQDALGNDVWDFATGMGLNVAGQGSFLRDLGFDPLTGDVYVRSSNNVFRGRRTGDNTCAMTLLVDAVDADTINLQNVCFVRTSGGTVVLWNDRWAGASGQDWADVIQAVRPDGSPNAIVWGSFAAPASVGAYDFSFDPGTGTLAIADFGNRKVHIFVVGVAPYYAYGLGCPGQGNYFPELSAAGALVPGLGGNLTYVLRQIAPLSLALVGLGLGTQSLPFGNGCTLLVDQIQVLLGPIVTGPGGAGSGMGGLPVTVPAGFPGFFIAAQGVVLENGSVAPLVWSNGVALIVP
ncbi:MAG TPA: hypothetical protein VFZ65_22355 [Planctomycetota bacterium]|nr:hypothetical protein [Planctomycetota bacterium]